LPGAPIGWQVDDPTLLEIHPNGRIRGLRPWMDENGVSREVKRMLTGATLRFDWRGSSSYEQRLEVTPVMVNPDHSSRIVGRETRVDRGTVGFGVTNPHLFFLRSSTTPGYNFTAEMVNAGTLVVVQKIDQAPTLPYVYAVR